MKDGVFLRHVRDYAKLSQRFRRSYKGVVDAILSNYIAALPSEGFDAEQVKLKTEWAEAVVKREYDPAEVRPPEGGEIRTSAVLR